MTDNLKRIVEAASGKKKPDLVIKNSKYLNVYTGEILKGDIAIQDGVIAGIGDYDGAINRYADGLVVPGFIDGHIHIESSMVTPKEFSSESFKHGTTTVVCDPHEIANVSGVYGIQFMMKNSMNAQIDFKFMLPSCVPATPFDENYAALSNKDLIAFYGDKNVLGLAEFMDFNSAIEADSHALSKIRSAKKRGLKIDGHAPMICDKRLNAYVAAGIGSDHECTALSEALEKLRLGQYIMIRQGTAAKNLPELYKLIDKYYDRCMFVTDDLHPEDLVGKGHIDHIIAEAIEFGADPKKAIICATRSPAEYFGLYDRGAIAPGKRADLVLLSDDYKVKGTISAKKADKLIDANWDFKSFEISPVSIDDLKAEPAIIEIVPRQLLTKEVNFNDEVKNYKELNKLFCAERHHNTGHKSACYLKGYGIKKGAVATSIAHDSHNIIAVGRDEDIVTAVNELIKIGGGIVVACGNDIKSLPLEIGGIMTSKPVSAVAEKLETLKKFAHELGVSDGIDPFMTLSFLSLPVIPSIRLLPTGVVRI